MQFTQQPPPLASTAALVDAVLQDWQRQVNERTQQFRDGPVTPATAYAFENDLHSLTQEATRALLESVYNSLEPAHRPQAAPRVRYHKATYRINKRTQATIATRFGPITLWSFLYLHEHDGEPGLHPVHVQLGIVAGATTVVAERVGRWAVDHSQSAVRDLLWAEHGLKWSNDRLRRVLGAFRRRVAPFRHEAQVERLLHWLAAARQSRGRHRPVLAVGRDGVMVPIRGHGFQEASAATVSVYDRRGRRLGTVYLGQPPEKQQTSLSAQLTALVTAVLTQWTGPLPRLAYVTDKGQAQDAYWRVLRRMKHPRRPARRLPWEWVLDFFHVCAYVGQLSEALFGRAGQAGAAWFRRMRHWLRDRRQGVAHILRSAIQHWQQRRRSRVARAAFGKAYRYLRRHSRWMAYERYRRQGLPLGSGVTEAACKTVFTQRLKRSGMRWHKESAQVIIDLRVLHLSGLWEKVVHKELSRRPVLERLAKASDRPHTPANRKKVA